MGTPGLFIMCPRGNGVAWCSTSIFSSTKLVHGRGNRFSRGLLDTNPSPSCGPFYEWYGPVFVNPYDPNRIVILATDGVKASSDSGATFLPDAVLTALTTASGTYPITRDYCARADLDGGTHSLPIATRALNLPLLATLRSCGKTPRLELPPPHSRAYSWTRATGSGTVWHPTYRSPPMPLQSASTTKTPVYVSFEGTQCCADRRPV